MVTGNNEIEALEDAMFQYNLFEKFNLNKIGVFGSVARGEHSNDIDLLIEDSIDYKLLSNLRDELQHHLNKRIDIVMAKYANPIVLHRASKEIVYVKRR
ncbi:MAG: nucleotidyltransferase domain-containing protein [Paenibacillaceae bacterium]